MTPFQRWELHTQEWRDCQLCSYSKTRRRIVLGKGTIPADIVFIGEAPGSNENMLGLPFVGKAGKRLDRIIESALGNENERKYRIAFNNVVACIPLVGRHQKEEPDAECVEACKPRVEEFLEIAQPLLVVAVGKTGEEWLYQGHRDSIKVPKSVKHICAIMHPAAIERLPYAAQGLAEHKCVVNIQTAIYEYLENAPNPKED